MKSTSSQATIVVLTAAMLLYAVLPARADTTYTWNGASGTGNWNDLASWDTKGIAPVGGSFSGYRVNVSSGGNVALQYTSATPTTYGNGLTNYRALVIAKGAMSINGASWTSTTVSSDLIGVGFAGTLSIDNGGSYTNLYGGLEFALGGGVGNLYVNTGSCSVSKIATRGNIYLNDKGVLSVGGFTAVPESSNFYFNGGTLSARNNSTTSYLNVTNAYVQNGGAVLDTGVYAITLTNVLTQYAGSSTGGLTKYGSGTLTLSAANTFTGATTVSAGVLALSNSAALQYSTLNYSAGSITFVGITSGTLGGLSGSQALSTNNSSGASVALTVGNNNASTAYSGILSGNGSLTKIGSGTLTLAGVNTYSGSTTVNAGELAIAVNGSINSNVYVASAGNAANDDSFTGSYAKFARQYTTAYTGLTSAINAGKFGTSATVGGNVTSGGTDTVVMAWSERNDSEASVLLSDVLNLTGASDATTLSMTYDANTLAARGMPTSSLYIGYWGGSSWLDAASMFGGTYDTSTSGTIVLNGATDLSGTFAVVPEPSTLALLAGALVGLIAYAWRKRK